MGKLHTFTTWRPIRYGEDALDAAFGPSWRQFFELEDEALGSGCVAQVYKGRFLAGEYTGEPIAVKVVDPSLKSTVDLDLSLMRGAATVLELLPRLHWLSIYETVNEFGQLMESQLDLRQEALNLERFRRDFGDDPSLVVPRPLYPWVTDNVLVEEFKEGEPISTYFGGEETRQLARMGLQAFLKMVFVHNFVHGDLHPGNLMVGRREDTGGPCLVVLDAGIVCELDQHDRKNFIDLFYAVVVGDGEQAGRLMIERVRKILRSFPLVVFHVGALSTSHLRRVKFKIRYSYLCLSYFFKATLAIQSTRSRQGISGVRIQKDFAGGSTPWCRRPDLEGCAWDKFRRDNC